MEQIQLSKRLLRLISYIPAHAKTLSDIGSDHAYLPCYAYQKGLISQAVAGEVNEGPYQSALRTVQSLGLEKVISVRLGDGLKVIKRGETDVVVIAGMGGSLIRKILDEGSDKLTSETTLILQPNVASDTVRDWLSSHGWSIFNEDILEEDGHIYEMLAAHQTAEPIQLTEIERLMGPYLIKKKDKVFEKKWRMELHKIENIIQSLSNTEQTDDIVQKKQQFIKKAEIIERGLNWDNIFTDKP
ncbi:tRNA (adenine22-N1)-methyltransferase [Scopulibacillus daqui]|uniref:tRNA (Adenine22-N1)-methyltransferase n=1 Tax=Scopulibacillus daqui TaxID=1469162 RepID=A0ABS2Q0G2_9BACL|nr:class I SAM-dependent methyltransferase [Scopulibacillus daqui]MBM7645783.1 tRNA (adenine22-N1)-methyltransferase [Scopulibacillus daqui]